MSVFTLCSGKGGAGRTVSSRLLSHGLAALGRDVLCVQLASSTVSPPFEREEGLPFAFERIWMEEDWRQELADTVSQWQCASQDVVIDLPGGVPREEHRLLAMSDVLLIPARPGPYDVHAACTTWDSMLAGVFEHPEVAPHCRPWIVPVGWSGSARGRRAILKALWTYGDDTTDMSQVAVLPWSLPYLDEDTVEELVAAADLREAPELSRAAALFAAGACRLAEDPAARIESLEQLFGTSRPGAPGRGRGGSPAPPA